MRSDVLPKRASLGQLPSTRPEVCALFEYFYMQQNAGRFLHFDACTPPGLCTPVHAGAAPGDTLLCYYMR